MRAILRRFLVLGCAVLAAALAAGTGRADPRNGPVDVSNQVGAWQTAWQQTLTAVAPTTGCGLGTATQPFLPWGDGAFYGLVPGGDQTIVLAGPNAEATTAASCVTTANPTLRFFVSDQGGTGTSYLQVAVRFPGPDGRTHSLTIARLQPGSTPAPTPAIPIAVDVLAALTPGGWTSVSFDFQAHGLQKGETYAIAGVAVDPRMGG